MNFITAKWSVNRSCCSMEWTFERQSTHTGIHRQVCACVTYTGIRSWFTSTGLQCATPITACGLLFNTGTYTLTMEYKCTYTPPLPYITQCTACTWRDTTTNSKLHTMSLVHKRMSPDTWGSSSGRGHVLLSLASTRQTCTQTRNSERKPTLMIQKYNNLNSNIA